MTVGNTELKCTIDFKNLQRAMNGNAPYIMKDRVARKTDLHHSSNCALAAKAHFVRILPVRDLRGEGQLSQILTENRGSAPT